MHARLSEKRPALVNRRGPILLHDNVRPHVARMTVQKLTELGYETLPHPPYSPDLSPTDYHLFKHLSAFLDGKTFRSKRPSKILNTKEPFHWRFSKQGQKTFQSNKSERMKTVDYESKIFVQEVRCSPGSRLSDDGSTCEDIDECIFLPCLNGGTCTNQPLGYRCSCPPSITGTNCNMSIQHDSWSRLQLPAIAAAALLVSFLTGARVSAALYDQFV
ncbi:EGF-like domain [Trinorchestia longiramus]|nr:EGF-like domain [Trinorchestia longiramus]